MAYYDIFLLSGDSEFLGRVAASYATETPLGDGVDPPLWATQHAWDVAAAPGFGDAYASALASGNEHPGSDASVITDGMILSAVQAIMAAELPEVPQEPEVDPEPPPEEPVLNPLDGGTDAEAV